MKIIECPRDAMQGIERFIPTGLKIQYINQLLKVGFDTVDFGSFVSPKAVPQMADSAQVYQDLENTGKSHLLVIIANRRGAETAASFPDIKYLGFPLSISETFQQRNTNKTIDQAFLLIEEIQKMLSTNEQELVVYLSMGFGNPYGDDYSSTYLLDFVTRLDSLGIRIISLADTIGVATPESIHSVLEQLISTFPHIEFGAHLHSTVDTSREKIEAVYASGCQRIDGALLGFGGCPMAADQLVGNLDTETIIDVLAISENEFNLGAFEKAKLLANQVFVS
jgi:hydroxymethylglutaryl-CoA lyase